uniref:Uncharacterized protein n=1 Tax=Arundo donax TaxID=35708 RepID=A0A0A9AN61_ARUDO
MREALSRQQGGTQRLIRTRRPLLEQ